MKFYENTIAAQRAYDEYLNGHITNVQQAFELLLTLDIPYVQENEDKLREICSVHDESKWSDKEYFPYLHHFYPTCQADIDCDEEYEQAVSYHVRNNRHHWNCDDWIDPVTNNLKGGIDEDLYKLYTIERICDWTAMSYQHGEKTPYDWWDKNKSGMIMPDYARDMIEDILHKIPNDYKLVYQITRGSLDESSTVDDKSQEKINTLLYLINDATDEELNNIANKLNIKTSNLVDYIKNNYVDDPDNIEIVVCNVLRKDREEYLNESYKVTIERNKYLVEASMKQLRRNSYTQDPTRVKKSKNVQSKYIGISKYGVLNFKTSSESNKGVYWYQELQFLSMQGFLNIVEEGDIIDTTDVKKMLQTDNVKLWCDDPSFTYWSWKYKGWRDQFGLKKETRAPKRNNTRLKGSLCKHLISVVDLLSDSRIIQLITNDLNQWCKMQLGKKQDGYQDLEGMTEKELKANQYDWDKDSMMKDLLTDEQFKLYQEGKSLEEIGLDDETIKDINKILDAARRKDDFAVKTAEDIAKENIKKRGRKMGSTNTTSNKYKLQVDTGAKTGENNSDSEEEQ